MMGRPWLVNFYPLAKRGFDSEDDDRSMPVNPL
jgi:hypothetical protein